MSERAGQQPGSYRLLRLVGNGSPGSVPNNLPVQFTPFVGREQELTAVRQLLQRDDVRLLTLTGPGGTGKTRLGLQVAAKLSDSFSGGAFFVNLAPISDPGLVVSTIAETLGIRERAGQSLFELLKENLQNKQVLLLLDNFEQVVSVSVQVLDLLAACPQLKGIVTSREVLHVRGEHEFVVPPLPLPDLKHLPDLAILSHNAAVALFISRVQAVKPDFHLNTTNARTIAEICTRLDGLPLAIELAAARIKMLPPRALLARLGQRLAVLTGGTRDAPERQQTLRNTIAWSYNLLDTGEQRLFRRLSIFVGGCSLQAVEALCAELDSSDEVGLVLERVASLVDKSMLQQTVQNGEEARFGMLETIREYGLELLTVNDEMEATQQAHASYYLALAEEAARTHNTPQLAEWFERLAREHDNLRATMVWSLDPARAGALQVVAYRLGEALTEFWWMRGFYSEARAFLEQVLARSEGVVASVRAQALSTAARFAFLQSDEKQAETLWQESLALYRECGDIRGMAPALEGISMIKANDVAALILQIEESLALCRESGDQEAIAWALFNLADCVRAAQGDYQRGYTLFEESLMLFRNLGNKRGVADCLRQSALWLFLSAQGDQGTIHQRLEESLVIYRELNDKLGIAFYRWVVGWAAFSQGDTLTAQDLIEQCLELCREMGMRWHACLVLAYLGRLKAHLGDFDRAHLLLEESLLEARTLDNIARAFCLERLAVVVAAQKEYTWATRLLGAAEFLRESGINFVSPVERADYEPTIVTARASLGEQVFPIVWAEGRAMTMDQVLLAREPVTLPESASNSRLPESAYPNGLTPREVEVLRLVAAGSSNQDIADRLVISERTVNSHLVHIFNKLGVNSRASAAAFAIREKLAD